jgi:hypothetical protein
VNNCSLLVSLYISRSIPEVTHKFCGCRSQYYTSRCSALVVAHQFCSGRCPSPPISQVPHLSPCHKLTTPHYSSFERRTYIHTDAGLVHHTIQLSLRSQPTHYQTDTKTHWLYEQCPTICVNSSVSRGFYLDLPMDYSPKLGILTSGCGGEESSRSLNATQL